MLTLLFLCDAPDLSLLVVSYPDVMPRRAEGTPGDVEPTAAGQQLVSHVVGLQERYQALELPRVLGTYVGSLAPQVLRVADTADESVDARVTEARVDDDGASDSLSGRLQQLTATVGHVGNLLYGGDVVGILTEFAEFRQREMITEFDVFH